MAIRRDVFQALADPTRRHIIGLVAKDSLNLNSVAENFKVSRPAISKHIKILVQCGLIEIRQKGRERFCEATLDKLGEASAWLHDYRQFWQVAADDIAIQAAVAKDHAIDETISAPMPKEELSDKMEVPDIKSADRPEDKIEIKAGENKEAVKAVPIQPRTHRKPKAIATEATTLQGSLFG